MRKLLVIAISLIMILSLSGCSSDSRIDELEQRVEVLESIVGINENPDNTTVNDNSTANGDTNQIIYNEIKEIYLYCDFDTEYHTSKTLYELRKDTDKCNFVYTYESGDIVSCSFSLDVYDEVVSLITASGIEEYEEKYDSNGKLTYEHLPYMLYILADTSSFYYLKTPSNIDDIVEKFESLKELAEG